MSSRAYWKQREAENLGMNLKTEEQYQKELDRIYSDMMDEITKEIEGFYARYAKSEGITLAESKRRASRIDIEAYERKAARYVRDREFSKEANEEMRLYNATMKINRLELLKSSIGMELVRGFDRAQKLSGKALNDRAVQEFKRQAGILGESVKNGEKKANAIVNASFHNARFSDRVWMNQDLLKAELEKLLQRGLISGKGPKELSKEVRKLFGSKKSDAERLLRTELARVQTEAQKQSFERNGYTEYEFVAEPTACPICRALDGKIFLVRKMMPGENAAPMHPNCRCSCAAHSDSADYEAWLNFLEKGGTTEEWRRRKEKRMARSEREMAYIKDDGARKHGAVNLELVNAAKYHRKFEGLTGHKAADESAYREVMEILGARNNTEFEEIVAIDAKTGARIAKSTDAVMAGKKHMCGFSRGQLEELEIYGGEYEVIHNHPSSSPPSRDDIQKLFERKKQKSSTVCCHDGTVYRVEKLKAHEDIDSLIHEVYTECKIQYGHLDKRSIETRTTAALIEKLGRSGHVRFDRR